MSAGQDSKTLPALAAVTMEYVKCNLCGQDNTVLVYRKRGKAVPVFFDIVKCKNCGLVYVNPRLPQSYVRQLYTHDYYEGKGLDENFVGSSQVKRRDAEILVRCLRETFVIESHKPRLLEVGGGEGLVSEHALSSGFDALMCDISDVAVQRSEAKGISSFCGEITDSFFDEYVRTYNVVVALEVIEHLYDPLGFLCRVYELLKPNGVFIYTTGNYQETRFWGHRWGYLSIPEAHIYFFTPKTIRMYFTKVGFQHLLDSYRYYTKNNIGTRFLASLKLLDLQRNTRPESLVEKTCYCVLFKAIEGILGRTRLPFAVK